MPWSVCSLIVVHEYICSQRPSCCAALTTTLRSLFAGLFGSAAVDVDGLFASVFAENGAYGWGRGARLLGWFALGMRQVGRVLQNLDGSSVDEL